MPDIAYIDTLDVCHLRCPTCVRGLRGMANTTDRMDLGTYGLIVDRLRQQGYRRLGLFSWTEPFLNPALQDYVAQAKARRMWVCASSTLSLPRIANLDHTLRAGLDLLIVSISGFDQETYEINHVGGVLEDVFANLRRLRESLDRHRLKTGVRLRMIAFDYNAGHEAPLRALAGDLGFRFEKIAGVGHPRAGTAVLTGGDYAALAVAAAAAP